jgi:hypothetical protein
MCHWGVLLGIRTAFKNVLTFQRGVTSAARHGGIFTSWNDEHCSSCYTLSLIGQYLFNIVTNGNRAFSCVFMTVRALLWCGKQVPDSISSFFLSSRILGFLFVTSNCTDGFVRLSNKEMKFETNVIVIVT